MPSGNTMKIRISATIDEKTDKILDSVMKTGRYRNKSHAIEELIRIGWEVENVKKK